MAAITLVTRLEGHADRVWDLAWQPAGDLLASCSGDQSIRIWTTVQGDWSCAKSLEGPQRGTIRSRKKCFPASSCAWLCGFLCLFSFLYASNSLIRLMML
eukprot:TRINITY_DN6138_c0_g1_i2.p1 TRINITY_DN6138_c0_g1~~TRINITY_DN6138_c0_g1_i2.p1  ORF type:complete len:100 (+),score=0.69 TRINITY_DN6138_c0_g1_i2:134-433(+)